jgi:uncharacterized protein YecE (DUF72 family)
MTAWVGTSGWQYADWRGRLYPPDLPQARWLAHYAETFATVEVNGSFYRLPRRETVERWASTVPSGFVLSFKASRYLTHVRRLRDCAEPLRRMWDVFEGAGAKLGPVLFQLPPNLPADLDRLAAFVGIMPGGMRAAFEFRHPSWSTEEVADILEASGCTLVHADRPGVRAAEIPAVGGWSYVRFHQGSGTAPGYERRKLASYADRIAALDARETFVYFNNDTGGAAVRDARTLTELLVERGVTVAGV